MQFTLTQVISLFIALLICWWALKKLAIHYIVRYLIKRRFCMKCMAFDNKDLVADATWTFIIGDSSVPFFLCEKCKQNEFPGEVGEFAEKQGFLKKNSNDSNLLT